MELPFIFLLIKVYKVWGFELKKFIREEFNNFLRLNFISSNGSFNNFNFWSLWQQKFILQIKQKSL